VNPKNGRSYHVDPGGSTRRARSPRTSMSIHRLVRTFQSENIPLAIRSTMPNRLLTFEIPGKDGELLPGFSRASPILADTNI
jgi:hypothetical protein